MKSSKGHCLSIVDPDISRYFEKYHPEHYRSKMKNESTDEVSPKEKFIGPLDTDEIMKKSEIWSNIAEMLENI